MDFLIDTIRQIETGKIEIDRSPKWIRSNVGTNNALNKLTGALNHMGFSNIPVWYALYSLAANVGKIDSSKINRELTKLEIEACSWKQKYENEKNDRYRDSEKYLELYYENKQLQKRIKELEGKGN